MEALPASAIIKAVAEYGILGLGWIVAIGTMFYVRAEQQRYQALVIHIIEYFTKVRLNERMQDVESVQPQGLDDKHLAAFKRLFGPTFGSTDHAQIPSQKEGREEDRRTSSD